MTLKSVILLILQRAKTTKI